MSEDLKKECYCNDDRGGGYFRNGHFSTCPMYNPQPEELKKEWEEILEATIIDGGYTLNDDKNWMSDLLAKERITNFWLEKLAKQQEKFVKYLPEGFTVESLDKAISKDPQAKDLIENYVSGYNACIADIKSKLK